MFSIEFDREVDGRWIAEISELPGCLVYASSMAEASAKVMALSKEILQARYNQTAP
jgi:predicted RNase H-like HicB family nuclease